MPARCRLAVLPLAFCAVFANTAAVPAKAAQANTPAWCRALPRPQYASLHRVEVHSSWFQVYRVAPGVFAIYEPHQQEETISYLILGSRRALLFDTGMGIGDLKSVVHELTPLPVVVVNSHTHNDHVGSNWQFDTVYGMDTEFTHANSLGARKDAQEELAPGEICGTLPEGFRPASYATRPWTISRFLHDGDTLDLGGRTLAIVATPGHTPDAISLLDAAHGLLFTGDTYYPGEIWLYRPETDLDAYARSVHRLALLAPQLNLVLGAHNAPVSKPDVLPRLDAAFAKVRSGNAHITARDASSATCTANGFSFRMRPPAK